MDERRLARLLSEYHAQVQAGGGMPDSPPSEMTSEELDAFRGAQQWVQMLDALWDRPSTCRSTRPRSVAVGETSVRQVAERLPSTQRFLVGRRLGVGGMGVVYEAFDRDRREHVAIKTMRQPSTQAVLELKREFRALADVRHRNLVALHQLHRVDDHWFFSMELVRGESFAQYFQPAAARHPGPSPARLSLQSALLQLLDGLEALHASGRIHRDIKPSNALVSESGRIVILDFGLSMSMHGGERRGAGAAGTWEYMSPEQAAAQPLSAASDLYSVGVMLYEILTGSVPFVGDVVDALCAKQWSEPTPPQTLRSGISPYWNQLCLALLHRNPADRPTIATLRCQLQLENQRPVTLHGPTRRSPAQHGSMPQGSRPNDVMKPVFVGRRAELAQLHAALDSVRQGRPTRVLVRGHSGYGKTSLVQTFLRQVWQPRVVLVQGRCYEKEAVPYKAWDDLMDTLVDQLRISGSDLASEVPAEHWLALLRLFPSFHRIRTLDASVCQRPAEPATERRRAAQTLRQLLCAIAAEHTLIVFVDDVHWGDADSAQLMLDVLHGHDPPPLLLVSTHRTEEESASPFMRAYDTQQRIAWQGVSLEVDVGPLHPRDAHKLAKRVLRGKRYKDSRSISQVVHESQCHPWFLVAMGEELSVGQASNLRETPIELDAMLAARIHRLPRAAQDLLEAVCLATHPLAEPVAYRVATITRDRDLAYSELQRSQLVRRTWHGGQVRLTPFHDRIRNLCARSMTPQHARRVHLRLAKTLEHEIAADPESIASHFRQAGQSRRAAFYYEQAGDRAVEALAFELAAHCYAEADQQVDFPREERAELLEKRALALAHAGRGGESAVDYQTAASLTDDAVIARRFRRAAAYQFCVSGHIEEGKAEFNRVLQPMRMTLFRSRWPIVCRWLTATAQLAWRRLDLPRHAAQPMVPQGRATQRCNERLLEQIDVTWEVAVGLTMIDTLQGAYFQARNLQLALRGGDPFRLARSCCWQATYTATAGAPKARHVERLLQTAERLGEGLNDPYLQALLVLSRGISNYFLGDWRHASQQCQQAACLFRNGCRGAAWETNTAHAFLLWALFFQGRVREMREQLPELLEDAQSRGDRLAQASLTNFGGPLVWLAADRPDRARQSLHETMVMWPDHEFHVQHFTCLAGTVQTLLYEDQAEAAWRHLRQRWPALRKSFFLRIEAIRVFMTHLRARTALAWHRQSGSRAALRQALRDARVLRRERTGWATPMAQLILAGAASLRRQYDAAQSHLNAALPTLRSYHLHLFADAAERTLAQLGDHSLARPRTVIDEHWQREGIRDPDRLCTLHLPFLVRDATAPKTARLS